MNKKDVCYFCSVKNAKYTCPRCNAIYCSHICYQSPNHTACSESFFKECVEEELRLENVDDPEKLKMQDILQRFHNEFLDEDINENIDSDDEDSVPDLSERLQNINLNDADRVWECLTEQEKQEFQFMLQTEKISEVIPPYEPWWSKRYDKKIEELESFLNKETEKQYIKICPPVIDIISFSTLSKVQPASLILWNIVNVLASYTFLIRRHVGDLHTKEAISNLFTICKNLSSNQNFESKETAIESVVYHANGNTDITCSPEEATLMLDDVEKLLVGPEKSAVEFYILSALSDLQQLLSQAHSRRSLRFF